MEPTSPILLLESLNYYWNLRQPINSRNGVCIWIKDIIFTLMKIWHYSTKLTHYVIDLTMKQLTSCVPLLSVHVGKSLSPNWVTSQLISFACLIDYWIYYVEFCTKNSIPLGDSSLQLGHHTFIKLRYWSLFD